MLGIVDTLDGYLQNADCHSRGLHGDGTVSCVTCVHVTVGKTTLWIRKRLESITHPSLEEYAVP